MAVSIERPKWQDDLESYRNLKACFLLSGNVHDLQLDIDAEGGCFTTSLHEYLYIYLQTLGYSNVIFYNRTDGFYNPINPPMASAFMEKYAKQLGWNEETKEYDYCFSDAAVVIRNALEGGTKEATAIIFDMVTTSVLSPTQLSETEREAFSHLLMGVEHAAQATSSDTKQVLTNTLFLVADKANDVPSWFFTNNPHVKALNITKPSRKQREAYLRQRADAFFDYAELEDVEKERFLGKVANLTESFCVVELRGFLDGCQEADGTSVNQVNDRISKFRYGRLENNWDHIDREKIADAETLMRSRVLGQNHAIDKAVEMLYYATSGFATSTSGASTAPKGVLFLAGPTGTGKTELAKALTEAIFSDQTQMVRFDMSEFGEAHSDQRLFGAPPGYVGYEAGGELTNAVRERPFSLFLFDEVEKAHPLILDKFLQIIDDGRLTDSHGETVYFGESIIVFTSNLGMTQIDPVSQTRKVLTAKTFEDREAFHEKVMEGIRAALRPEFVNRIGDNFVVFDFITPENAEAILKSKLRAVGLRQYEEHGIDLYISHDYYKQLLETISEDTSMGGRGIVNKVKSLFYAPVAKALAMMDSPAEGPVSIVDLVRTEGGPAEAEITLGILSPAQGVRLSELT